MFVCSQYQVQLNECDDDDGGLLIYAPRDEDRYITRASDTPEYIQIDRRVSHERKLIRKLEKSLYSCIDDRKQALYDKVSKRHKQVMDLIVADLHRGLARPA